MTSTIVKSVGRVFDVLELFQHQREPLKASKISLAVGVPKSSTSALLKSMVQLGYLSYDHKAHKYFPTMRVHGLGEWLPTLLLGEETSRMLHDLHERTSETVGLAVRNGLRMEFISVLPGKFPISLSIMNGFLVPILGTAVGTAYMTTLSETQLIELFKNTESIEPDVAARVSLQEIRSEIELAKKVGYAASYDRFIQDSGAIAWALPEKITTHPQVMAVGGSSPRIRRSEEALLKIILSLLPK